MAIFKTLILQRNNTNLKCDIQGRFDLLTTFRDQMLVIQIMDKNPIPFPILLDTEINILVENEIYTCDGLISGLDKNDIQYIFAPLKLR